MNHYLIKNVRIFDPENHLDQVGDLRISDGVIAEIGQNLNANSKETQIDGQDKILFPGFVDLHTHLREPGFEYKESIATGTQAAAAGGFTTICCMANTEPVNDNAAITRYILEKAQAAAAIEVWPIGAITQGLAGEKLAEIGEMKSAGCVGISDDGMTVMNSELMRMGMDYAKGFEIPVITHSIDANLSRNGSMHEGQVSCELGLKGVPAEAEDIIVARDIYLSQLTGCHLHVAHVSTAGSVELIRQAKQKGLVVTGEAAPHHFTLTDEACREYATHAKMCPPLRSEEHRQAVIAGLSDGTLDVIATDHAPHATIDKEIEFDKAAFGITGLETAFALSYALVLEKKLSLADLLKKLTVNPLKVLAKKYMGIQKSAPANLALVDLNKQWKYQVSESFSKSRNSPFDGWDLQGQVLMTWYQGKRVFDRE